jgi:flagellar export protein FliJ
MPSFRFRLAPVLRLRERNREEQRLALAAVEEERKQLKGEIQRLENLLATQEQEMARVGGPLLAGIDLQLQGEFIQRVVRRKQECRALLVTVEQRLEEKRVLLLQADTKVRSLEQLKIRGQERYRQQEDTKEQQRTDEVGQRNYLDQKTSA